MKKFIILIFLLINVPSLISAKDYEFKAEDLFHLDQMNSHNQNFAL